MANVTSSIKPEVHNVLQRHQEDRATSTGDLHKTFCDNRSSGSRDMLADRQTDKLTAILRCPTGVRPVWHWTLWTVASWTAGVEGVNISRIRGQQLKTVTPGMVEVDETCERPSRRRTKDIMDIMDSIYTARITSLNGPHRSCVAKITI